MENKKECLTKCFSWQSWLERFKSKRGWLLFLGTLIVVFLLGILAASVTSRRAQTASIYNNKRVIITGIEGRNEIFGENYPREYETWANSADTGFTSMYNGSKVVDILEARPNMVILWAGYAFSKDYTSPRGHIYAVDDVRRSLRTGAPMNPEDGPQKATCWACKSPDVPRMMQSLGVDEFYKKTLASLGSEIVNPVGCANCHEPERMELKITQPALIEAFSRQGRDIKKATQQELRSLVCAQCHSEYFFKNGYLTFPWDKGTTVEAVEAYYDELKFSDFTHKLSKAPIIKAQHPGYEIHRLGIHGQRGVSCADCHMPYMREGGVKFSDHQVRSPLAMIDRTCQVCHRESEAELRQNVYERQTKVMEVRTKLEAELAKAHIEAAFAWEKGATEAQMASTLKLLRQSQWRWDYAFASHGASFHAPQEIQRIMSNGIEKALQARLATAKVLAALGFNGDVPMPDVSTKEKAQRYVGWDIPKEKAAKEKFLNEIVPKWIEEAKANNRLAK
ncbi:MAG: ammonia-forming cytochrome c nitrite reductase [Spirochaetia bacterium]|jgi:nitrite reductase (cytochrome c-552)|nr:ammonia-forming cytochrome c nitrite reductase [Spirochaetia bacterium]